MSSLTTIFIIAFLAAILLDAVLLRWMAKKNRNRVATPQDVKIFGVYSPITTKLKRIFLLLSAYLEKKWSVIISKFRSLNWKALARGLTENKKFWITVELLIILLWSYSYTLPYLDMDPLIIPAGNEYSSVTQAHHLWTRFLQCGACFMWDGSIRGGTPAFVDPHSSMLHPLVVIATLLAGVRNGVKLSLVVIFMFAGLVQWWLAYMLGLGRIPRLWSGMMAVVGGHLASRMELGLFGMVLSTACVSSVIPALIWLVQTRSRRAIVILGISLASAVLSGQGYMQLGLLFIFPATFLLIPWDTKNIELLLKHLALAGLIGFLLASPFLLPYLHFLPEFGKELNPEFNGAQPLKFLPLNLVIGDHDFYRTESLQKFPYPSIYENYIGWIPVILAIIALFGARNPKEKRVIRFLFAAGVVAAWAASAMPLKWLIENIHFKQLIDVVAGIRHPTYIFGLAVTAALGLAAIGLDQILKREWPLMKFDFSSAQTKSRLININLKWLMAIPLLFSLADARFYNEVWIHTVMEDPVIQKVNEALLPPDLQWVNPPYGQHEYIESAVGLGIKLSSGTRAWFWKDRTQPGPVREASFTGDPPNMIQYALVKDVVLYKAAPGSEYAQVIYSDNSKPTICEAHGIGGDIDVICDNPFAGTLVVKENNWTGWHVRLDGQRVRLNHEDWFSLSLPPGEHRISFRYRPWDVPLGIALSLLGLFISVVLWVKKDPPLTEEEISDSESQPQEVSQEQAEG